ncbi:MAG: hypothetical protein RLZZ447_989 [Verrucomicrobiota bacterium]
MHYLDTSYLLKLYAQENGSAEVTAWRTGRRGFVCSRHGKLELVSGLKRHQREGRIDTVGLGQSLAQLAADETRRLIIWLPLENNLFDDACARLAALQPSVFIRAADALHLVCAAKAGLKAIYSHDRHLLAAAPHFGLEGIDILSSR